jgi:hypothetical protein
MKINKQLLEELILEVLEEDAELDEVFGGVARTVNRALGRQPRMQDRGVGTDTSSLSGAGAVKSRLGGSAAATVLNQLRDILGDQSSTRRAAYMAQLMIDLGIEEADIARVRSQIQQKMAAARSQTTNKATMSSRGDRDKEFAAKMPPPVKRVAERKRHRKIRIRRKK